MGALLMKRKGTSERLDFEVWAVFEETFWIVVDDALDGRFVVFTFAHFQSGFDDGEWVRYAPIAG